MTDLHTLLQTPPLLFEGAMGTALIQRGLPAGQPAELCTLEHPDVVADIHRGYVAAGARALKTNTFNANRLRLEQAGLADRLVDCNCQAIAIAREVAGDQCIIAGSVGPTGVLLPSAGTGAETDLIRAYNEQAAVMEEAGVDVFLVETMFDVREARAALAACQRVSRKPVIVTMTFTRTPRGYLTVTGDGAGDALTELVDAGAFAVGANCNLDSDSMVPLAAGIRRHVAVPILIQPCGGEPQMRRHGLSEPQSPAVFARNMARIVQQGAEMIGGCCGTTTEFIERTRRELDAVGE